MRGRRKKLDVGVQVVTPLLGVLVACARDSRFNCDRVPDLRSRQAALRLFKDETPCWCKATASTRNANCDECRAATRHCYYTELRYAPGGVEKLAIKPASFWRMQSKYKTKARSVCVGGGRVGGGNLEMLHAFADLNNGASRLVADDHGLFHNEIPDSPLMHGRQSTLPLYGWLLRTLPGFCFQKATCIYVQRILAHACVRDDVKALFHMAARHVMRISTSNLVSRYLRLR